MLIFYTRLLYSGYKNLQQCIFRQQSLLHNTRRGFCTLVLHFLATVTQRWARNGHIWRDGAARCGVDRDQQIAPPLNGRRQRVVKDETTKPPLRDMTEVFGAQRGEQVLTELTMEVEAEIDSKVS